MTEMEKEPMIETTIEMETIAIKMGKEMDLETIKMAIITEIIIKTITVLVVEDL